jgi:hypothetical protein
LVRKIFTYSIDFCNSYRPNHRFFFALNALLLDRLPEGIQGGIWPTPPEAVNLAQWFIAVEDVSASVSRAMAVLLDPQGISFGVYHRSGR